MAWAQKPSGKKPTSKKTPVFTPILTSDSLKTTTVPNDSDEFETDATDTITPKTASSAIQSKVKYSARDSIVYRASEKTVYLYGNAKVFYEDLTLESDQIKIELDKNLIHSTGSKDSSGMLIGTPFFKQGSQEYRAEKISYNYKTKRGYLSEFKTKEGEGFIHGTDVKKNEYNEFGIRDAYYTTCEAEKPHFHISANKLKVIPEKKVIAKWPNLIVEGMNTPLLFPFGVFPIQRGQSSGVIIPTYGSSIDRGFFLRNGGYYFGLGDHSDLQLTADIYANLSWGLHAVSRYATRYRYSGNFIVNFARNTFNEPTDPNYSEQNDFQITWTHAQDAKARPGTVFTSNVNLVTNSYLANNSYNTQNIVNNNIMSGISYSKSFAGGKYNFSTVANTSQTLLTRDITFQMPDFTFTVSSFNPLKSRKKPIADKWYENISMNYMVQFRNRFTTKDTLLFKSRTADEFSKFYDTTGSFGVLHTLPVQTSFKVLKYYTLSGSIGFNEYWYLNSVVKDTVNGGVRTTKVREFSRALTFSPSVSITTRYYGMKNFAKGKIAAIRHVINPSLGFRYTPDFSDDMWGYYKSYRDASGREIKYSRFEGGLMGGPGSGRQGNIEFGVDNNLELKVRRGKDTAMREEKVQIFETFRVGSSYNIFVDSMNLSIINVSARTRLFKNISINSAANFDPYTNTVNTSSNGFKSVNRIKQYAWNNNSFPLMRDASLGVTASFNRDLFKSKSSDRTGMQGELKYINDFPNQYADFSIPWSLNISYSMSYDHYRNLNLPNESNFTQSILFNGDFNLTKKWKINYTSGYDIRNRQFTLTSIDVTRDLHCWQFTFNWIPFGARQSFLFTINVKSSVLQELKLTRRRDWFDRPI